MTTTSEVRVGDVLPGLGPVIEVIRRTGWRRITFDQGTGYVTFDVPAGLVLEVERQTPQGEARPRRAATSVQSKSQFQQAPPTPALQPTPTSPVASPIASAVIVSASPASSESGASPAASPATQAPVPSGHSYDFDEEYGLK